MMGYTEDDIEQMKYGIQSAILLINTDENPAITRYLQETADFLDGLLVEGRI